MKWEVKEHKNDTGKKTAKPKQGDVEIRKDLQDPSRGKDLSYLNEMPQMGGYEGVKAGVPPPKEKKKKEDDKVKKGR